MINIENIISRYDLPIHTFKELKSGYSNAKKFTLFSKNNEPLYILKIYDIKKMDRIKLQFNLLKKHYENGVLCHQPIAFGIDEKKQICYLVLSYVGGISGDVVLSSMEPDLQNKVGIQAGEQLSKLHLITQNSSFNWYKKRLEKYQNKIKICKELGLTFYKQKYIENYIDEHVSIIKNSRVCFQHDDFHPQNLIIKDRKLNGIIDFDSFDWGDPLEEFFKLPKYTIQVSDYFAKGQIIGYFDNQIPDFFWTKYNLFVALNLHASQISGYSMGNLKYVQERTRHIIETHDFINNREPEWFTNCNL